MGLSQSSPKSRKRRRSPSSDEEEKSSRKRIKGTSKYIYEHMFVNGESSDVEVHAAGKVWKLHKVYLKQSPFFKAMFDGKWSDSESSVIDLAYEDPNITVEALDVCLGSFYDGELRLTETNVSGVSAAATLLSLDEICSVCEDFMQANLESSTVLNYYSLACDYGLVALKASCLSWLRNNLMILPEKDKLMLITKLDSTMIETVISSSEFFVYYSEYDIFLLLVKWIYLALHPDAMSHTSNLSETVFDYFATGRNGEPPFLMSTSGCSYVSVFHCLHFHDLLKYKDFAKNVEKMKVFPTEQLLDGYRYLWLTNVQADRVWIGNSTREAEEAEAPCSEELFWRFCSRGGRVLKNDERHSWRWPTFHFGIDLVFTYHNRRLYVSRSGRLDTTDPAIATPLIRVPFYRVMMSHRIFSLSAKGHITHLVRSEDVRTLSLGTEDSHKVAQLPVEMAFPVFVQLNVLVRSPPGAAND